MFKKRFAASLRGTSIILPHVSHSNFMSAPTRIIFHVFPPHGCFFRDRITSPVTKSLIRLHLLDAFFPLLPGHKDLARTLAVAF